MYDALDRASKNPWRRGDFPAVAKWLGENAAALDLLASGLRRPSYYSPIVHEDGHTLLDLDCVGASALGRKAAGFLSARAMLRVGEGEVDDAWHDLLCCHRLGRANARQPLLVDALLAGVIRETACRGTAALADGGRLTAAQARRIADDLGRLPPPPSLAETFDWGERLFFLDGLLDVARRGAASKSLAWSTDESRAPRVKQCLADPRLDWNHVLRVSNLQIDRLVEALRKPSYQQRTAGYAQVTADCQRLRDGHASAEVGQRFVGVPAGSLELAARVGGYLLADFCESCRALVAWDLERSTRQEVTLLALAVAGYRADRGKYPAELHDLAPHYAKDIPSDGFSGGPLRYRLEGDGYLLYSVGRNGLDDGGRNDRLKPPPDDERNGTQGRRVADDIAVGKIP